MHLHSINLSAIAKISSLILVKLSTVCFYCSNNCNLSDSSLGSHDNHLTFDSSRDPAMLAGELNIFVSQLSPTDLLPRAFSSNYNSFAEWDLFLSDNLAWSTL